ncbi:MAG: DMT family transporter [Dehalococcoidia bacterium]|nr:MAG: DMT family transporter [Dehalococcoidia bacterium]
MSFTNWRTSPRLASFALMGVAAVWGSTFIVVQEAVSRMPVMDFLAVRFSVATLILIAIRPKCLQGLTRLGFLRAIALGLVLGLAYITQTFGLQHTSAAVSGFITGLFVVLTPLLSAILLRHRVNRNVWVAVILATAGLALLSLSSWAIGIGELLTLFCALFFALHIIGLGEWSAKHDVYSLAVLQIGFVAVMSIFAAIPGGFTLPPDAVTWGAVVLTAVFATAVAFFVQTWAQSLISPTRTAIIITMEPAFGGLFAVLFAGQLLTLRFIIGGALVLGAMILTELKQKIPPAGPHTIAIAQDTDSISQR